MDITNIRTLRLMEGEQRQEEVSNAHFQRQSQNNKLFSRGFPSKVKMERYSSKLPREEVQNRHAFKRKGGNGRELSYDFRIFYNCN